MKVIIIGSGIAGLASAVRMAVKGHEVQVYEANDYVGGKLSQWEQNGFRFDAGPSLYTMPEHFEELFALAGKSFQDYCPYNRLDVITHYLYPDGKQMKAYADPTKFAKEASEKLNVKEADVLAHLKQSDKLYDLTHNIFLNKSLHTVKQQSAKDLLKAGLHFRSLDLFRTMHKANAKRFGSNKHAIQLFDRFATYNGSDPYQAPATLNIIPHLEHNMGAFFPQNGMYSLTESMYRLGTELGVTYHLGQKVDRINVSNKKATGITIGKEMIKADKVISNVDVFFTYKHLLKGQPSPRKVLDQPQSSSALIFYWGIDRQFEELGLHNILFSEDYHQEFKTIFREKTVPGDPTVYINITSKLKPSDAPEGCENWFTMINVPNNSGQDWDRLIQQARQSVINKINKMMGTDISKHIVTEDLLEPRTIESRTGSNSGALYGTSSNNRMAAFMRHPNFSKKIKDLYFCGGSVHPGGGIPLCMLSAKIVDDLMHNAEQNRNNLFS